MFIKKGEKPSLVLEKVFKQYKGTIHDTPYWKNLVKQAIDQYAKEINIQSSSRRKLSSRKRQTRKRRKSKK